MNVLNINIIPLLQFCDDTEQRYLKYRLSVLFKTESPSLLSELFLFMFVISLGSLNRRQGKKRRRRPSGRHFSAI